MPPLGSVALIAITGKPNNGLMLLERYKIKPYSLWITLNKISIPTAYITDVKTN